MLATLTSDLGEGWGWGPSTWHMGEGSGLPSVLQGSWESCFLEHIQVTLSTGVMGNYHQGRGLVGGDRGRGSG